MRKINKLNLPKQYREELAEIQANWSKASFRKNRPDDWKEEVWRGDYRMFLQRIQFGMCVFCETLVIAGSNGDVEHFWPKVIYSDFKFTWSNWFLSCRKCNNAKGQRDSKAQEWVDPALEDPVPYFYLLDTGKIVPHPLISKDKKDIAQAMIDGADLNCERTKRPKILKSARKSKMRDLTVLIDLYGDEPSTRGKNRIAKAIIKTVSNQESHLAGIGLMWLRQQAYEKKIPRSVYTQAQAALNKNSHDRKVIFAT